jgi:hypothetical protein
MSQASQTIEVMRGGRTSHPWCSMWHLWQQSMALQQAKKNLEHFFPL